MAMTIETFVNNILTGATAAGDGSTILLDAGIAQNEVLPGQVAPTKVANPAIGDYSELTGIPLPENFIQDLTDLMNEIRDMYADNFPEVLTDLTDRAAIATTIQGIIDGSGNLSGEDYESEVLLLKKSLDEDLLISENRIRDQWAAMGYPVAPGQMIRNLSEEYTIKFRQFHDGRMKIMESSIKSILPQFKAALKLAQEMALSTRVDAINAMSSVIMSSAKASTIPSENYASQVAVRSAMADALIAKYNAAKEFDKQLLKTFVANLDAESAVNRYYASMHPREIGNEIELAVAKANSSGTEAASLWNALNVVVSDAKIVLP